MEFATDNLLVANSGLVVFLGRFRGDLGFCGGDRVLASHRLLMEQPLAVNAENSRAKVQNVGGDSSAICL